MFALQTGAQPLVAGDATAKGISIPLYGYDKTKPAAHLKIRSLTLEGQHYGFLQIGILPALVGQDVEIVFNGNKIDPEALRDLTSAIHAVAKTDSVEFHHFSIRTAASGQPEIYAETAHILANRPWELTQAATKDGQTAAKAKLMTRGDSAGNLIIRKPNRAEGSAIQPAAQQ